MRNPHGILVPLRPGKEWRCKYCGQQGTLAEMHEPKALATDTEYKVCTYVYPPCKWCGQAPLCAADCVGIALTLSDPEVYVAGYWEERDR